MKTLTRTLLCMAALTMAACRTTHVVSVWKAPELTTLSFDHVVVIAATRSPINRRAMEDQLVRRLSIEATPSYTLTPQGPAGEELRALIRDGRFDGAIVMRLVSVERETSWVPGGWVGPYWGTLGWGMFDPGHYQVDTYVRLETNVYWMPEELLVWAASSRTVNPASLDALVDETMQAITAELKKQGLIGRGR